MDTMIPDRPFDLVSWYQALTLTERAEALRRTATVPPEPPLDPGPPPARFARWRAQAPFGDQALFHRRLAADGLTEPLLRRRAGAPVSQVLGDAPARAPWLVALERAFAAPASDEPLALPAKFAGVPTRGFLELARPLIVDGRRRLRAAAAGLARGL